MPLTVRHFQTHSNDFQTAENVLAQAKQEGLPPKTLEIFQDMVEETGFEKSDVAAKKENKQYVLQGQLLVLGDSRNGKTSLVKAITGEEFNMEEIQTSGVEFKFVDRKWKTLDLQNLKFGDFNKYSKKSVRNIKLFARTFNVSSDVGNLADEALSFVVFFLILPIILEAFEGDSKAVMDFGYLMIMARFLYQAFKGKCSVIMLLTIYLRIVAMSLVRTLFGCFPDNDEPVLEVHSSFLHDLLTTDKIPSFVVGPMFFFVVHCCIFVAMLAIMILLQRLLPTFSMTRTPVLVLNFVFSPPKEVLEPVTAALLLYQFIFLAPAGLFCNKDSFFYQCECIFTFLIHIALLNYQNTLKKPHTLAVISVEFGIIISLCFTDADSRHIIINVIANVMLFSLGIYLHGRGKCLQFKDDFNGKTFTQVVFNKDFLLHTIRIKKTLIDMPRLKNALSEKFNLLKLKILDFAGDEEYYAYHQIFLNSNAIYVVVFNIQEYIRDNFKDIRTKVRRLRFWLESIHSHVPQGTPIFLVGTHRANIEMDILRKINTYINDAVGQLFLDEIVLNKEDDLMFFHVENSRGQKDIGVISLRNKIRSLAEDELKDVMGQEIPLSWIKVQDAIIKYQENRQTPACSTVQDFKEMFGNLYVKWSEEMLKYFHKKGFIIYVDKEKNDGLSAEAMAEKNEGLSKWVLLKPDVLVQIVILLISQPEELTETRGLRKDWIPLKKFGKLTKTLLQFIVSRTTGHQSTEESSLIAFLEEYDLICPFKDLFRDMEHLPDIKQITHLVPSLLPAASESQTLWLESSEDVKFYIFFDSYVPEAFFFRLLSRSCKASYDEMESYEPQIYRDCGVFWYSQQMYRLRIMKDEGLIEVTMTKSSGFWKPFDILRAIAIRVEDIRNRDFHNLFFHCGPECSSPVCPGSCTDSTSLLTDQPRRHVYNVYPACKQKGPKCFKDFFKCQNVFRGEDAEIWKPPPINRGPIEGLRLMEHSQGW